MDDTILIRRVHRIAVVSFVLGLASLGLLILTGVPALLLGLRGLREVNASDGRLRGARLAIAGMILGGLGTLVTLLGAFVIIAVELRLKSTRAECINNLRQIGVALNKYADTHRRFPAATRDPRQFAPNQRLSWLADVVPLLGDGTPKTARYQTLAEKIDHSKGWKDAANAAAVMTPVRIFLCPGHPDYRPTRAPGLTHYVGVAGIDPGAADLPREDVRAGMFGHDRGVSRRQAERGISYTMMVLETTRDNGPWLAGGYPTVRGLAPDEEQYIGPGRPFGGMHSGVVNVLWVDGSVKPMKDDTPGELFRALATLQQR
jgi:prepilin-type processing-associated H-X9-DG protein